MTQSIDGTVGREYVLRILQENGVSVAPNSESGELVLTKDNIIDSRKLPEIVGRRLVHYLSRRFKVHIHLFYN